MEIKLIAKERAEWLLDAIAVATQNPIFDRDSLLYDEVAGDAILMNGERAITTAISKYQLLKDHPQKEKRTKDAMERLSKR